MDATKAPSAGSLANLHDILLPSPVPWWPPAPGWYVILALLIVLGGVLALRWWLRRRANAYRREALALADSVTPAELPELLKRVALSAWPRERVAALANKPWWDFFARSGGAAFPEEQGRALSRLSYDPNAELDADGERALRSAARRWIGSHRADRSGS